MERFRRDRVGKERFNVRRPKPIRPVAKLAGDGDRTLLLQNILHLVSTEGPQQPRYASLVAAALELHRRAAEQAHVVLSESSLQQLLNRAVEQIIGAQFLDALLGILPGRLDIGFVSI